MENRDDCEEGFLVYDNEIFLNFLNWEKSTGEKISKIKMAAKNYSERLSKGHLDVEVCGGIENISSLINFVLWINFSSCGSCQSQLEFEGFQKYFKEIGLYDVMISKISLEQRIIEKFKTENKFSLQFLPQKLREERELVFIATARSTEEFRFIGSKYSNDRDIFINSLSRYDYRRRIRRKLGIDEEEICPMEYASEELKDDSKFILEIIKYDKRVLRWVDPKIKDDDTVMLRLLEENPFALEYAPGKIRDSELVVTNCASKELKSLEYASIRLKNSERLALKLIVGFNSNNVKDHPIQFLSDHFISSRKIVMAMVERDGRTLTYADKKLKDDYDIVLKAVKSEFTCTDVEKNHPFLFASERLKGDITIVSEVIKKYGVLLKYASEEKQADRDLVLIATMSKYPLEYSHVPPELKNDKDIIRIFNRNIKKNSYIRDLPEHILEEMDHDNLDENIHLYQFISGTQDLSIEEYRRKGGNEGLIQKFILKNLGEDPKLIKESGTLDEEYLKRAMRKNLECVFHIPGFENKKEWILLALRNNYSKSRRLWRRIFKYSSEIIKKDKDFSKKVVKLHFKVIGEEDFQFKNDEEILLSAFKGIRKEKDVIELLQHISDDILVSKPYSFLLNILEILSRDYKIAAKVFRFVIDKDETILYDHDFMLRFFETKNSEYILFKCDEVEKVTLKKAMTVIEGDISALEIICKINPNFMICSKFSPTIEQLRNDYKFFIKVLPSNIGVIEYVGDDLKKSDVLGKYCEGVFEKLSQNDMKDDIFSLLPYLAEYFGSAKNYGKCLKFLWLYSCWANLCGMEVYRKFLKFRARVLKDLDPLRSIRDRFRLYLSTRIFDHFEVDTTFMFELQKIPTQQIKKWIEESRRRCGKFVPQSYPFWSLESGIKNEDGAHSDLIEYNFFRFRLDSLSLSDVEIIDFLGSGAYGYVFVCRSKFFDRLLVLKLLPGVDAKQTKNAELDDLSDLPYHENVAMTYGVSRKSEDLVQLVKSFKGDKRLKRLSKDVLGSLEKKISRMVFMCHYRKDLRKFVNQRKDAQEEFSPLEICVMMLGILRGVNHLHDNHVVHRDLHPGNIFVDEFVSRIWVADFGSCLRFKSDENFVIKRGDPRLKFRSTFSSTSFLGGEYEISKDCVRFLAPEIVEFDEKKSVELNYDSSDLYSCGIIAKVLLLSCDTKIHGILLDCMKKLVEILTVKDPNERKVKILSKLQEFHPRINPADDAIDLALFVEYAIRKFHVSQEGTDTSSDESESNEEEGDDD